MGSRVVEVLRVGCDALPPILSLFHSVLFFFSSPYQSVFNYC